ncbi:MAG: ferritin-like domain-containing protein [bacterium JZ-2024 1]
MSELIKENKPGVSRSTPVEEALEANFRGETAEVGLYLSMARQAQREGYSEIAEVLKSIAMDEAWHSARYAEWNGKISASTKEKIEKMLNGEQSANKGKQESDVRAKEAGVDEAFLKKARLMFVKCVVQN